MKNRIELAEFFASEGFTWGAEIGVCDGRYSEILCQTIPNLYLICVDNWEGQWASAYQKAVEKLRPYNVSIVKAPSVEAAKNVTGKLDFVFIDAEHSYKSVKADIEAWAARVRYGGIVSGHDYYMTRHGNMGVIQAVNEYADRNGYLLQFTRWDLSAYEDDRQPCWYFRKVRQP